MRTRIQIAFSILALAFLPNASARSEPSAQDREMLVAQFIEAFNRQDPDAMMRLMAPDIQWLSVDGDKISAEGRSRDEIGASMKSYFKSCPTCRSKLERVIATPKRLSAIEVAQWKKGDVAKEQRSVSVYEFAGPLISRVYYFPAER